MLISALKSDYLVPVSVEGISKCPILQVLVALIVPMLSRPSKPQIPISAVVVTTPILARFLSSIAVLGAPNEMQSNAPAHGNTTQYTSLDRASSAVPLLSNLPTWRLGMAIPPRHNVRRDADDGNGS